MIAHVGGVPVEEAVLPVLPAAGMALALARAWVVSALRGRRGRGREARTR